MRIENPTVSSIPRCLHGVYHAFSDRGPNPECSICTPILVTGEHVKVLILRDPETGSWKNIKD
jgi:hypothetical protein